jgi:hypothetical protein
MTIKKDLLLPLFLFLPFAFNAQAELIFNDLLLEEPLESAVQKLNSISETFNLTEVSAPTFPLAKDKEQHLVCSNIKTPKGVIREAVFTFADGKLTYIEARGNVYSVLASSRADTARSYMSYDVYVADKLFLDKEQDAAWIMTKEAMHTNLFTWNNPYLTPGYKTDKVSSSLSPIPKFLKMGGPLDSLEQVLNANSKHTFTEVLDGKDPNAQIQINCFGVSYAGFPRKVEARFGDDQLNVAWILTAKGEEDRIRQALTEEFGSPIFVNDDWEVFNNWQVALRKDKPEVLLIEQQLGLQYKTSFFKQ